ncbi:MAG: peptidylprolyl isomerase [Candidatus Hydrogenedentes bacterium]|nr:peptidylprolyl isomerase [Candidatus Hydrogenedentota bacterium]
MSLRRIIVRAICAIVVVAAAPLAFAAEAPGPAEKAKADASGKDTTPVATIGDKEVITKDELDRAVAASEQMAMMQQRARGIAAPAGAKLNQEGKMRALEALVNSRILLMMTREAGVKVPDETVKAEVEKKKADLPAGTDYASFLKQRGITEQEVFDRTKQMLEIKAFEELKTKEIAVTDDEIKQQYDRMKERGLMDDFDVQHILVKATQGDQAAVAEAKKKIDAAAERLKKGEDFAAVAKEVSEDPGSKDKGGEYKGVRRGQMVPEFDKRMAEAKVGEVTAPFTTQFGWHIIKVNRHSTGELTAEMVEKIKPQILMAKQKMAMRDLVQEKRKTLNITISMPAEAPASAPAPSGEPAPALDSLVDAAS